MIRTAVTMDGFSYEGNGAVTDWHWNRSKTVLLIKKRDILTATDRSSGALWRPPVLNRSVALIAKTVHSYTAAVHKIEEGRSDPRASNLQE